MRTALARLCTAIALAVAPGALAQAAELYFAGQLGISTTEVDGGGSTQFFTISGSDDDASPAYGGTLGFGVEINELLPSVRLPRLQEMALPAWKLRVELEGLTGRDWEFRTDGGDGFFTEVESDSYMLNLWLDVPLHPTVRRFMGRMPMFEPLSLTIGGGIGRTTLDIETTDNVSRGDESESETSFQYGIGFTYALTNWTKIQFGYRVLDLGDVEVPLSFQPATPIGQHDFEFETREFFTTLRYDFYAAPLEDMHPRHWRLPRLPRFKLPRPRLPRLW